MNRRLSLDKSAKAGAIVLACRGGAQGDLSVVRTLGRAGIPVTVVAEYPNAPASRSRYCVESHVVGSFARDRESVVERLLEIADRHVEPPVLFPTADPDLRMLSDCREMLHPKFRHFLSERSTVEICLDKGSFYTYASQFDVPIPRTSVPDSREEVVRDGELLRYPIIMKPARPDSWNDHNITQIVAGKKAVVAKDSLELLDWYDRIAPHGKDVVLQEYIPGRDDRLYSLHAYISKDGTPLGIFTGQKIRTWPTYAGIGCFVKSVYVPEIVDSGLKLLKDMRYTGAALLQYKRDESDGIYKLLEINPRASSWNLLAYACGVNLPHIAYKDVVGLPAQRLPRQREGVRYIYFDHDRKAFLDYLRHRDISVGEWIRSLIGKNVYQYYATDDLGPFVLLLKDKLASRL